MNHKGSSGREYRWAKVLPRHFGHTAREVGLKIPELNALLQEFADTKDAVIDKVAQNLPTDINEEVRDRIFTGFNATASKITDVT
ncbi:hypothetical protein [Vibrio breoganii]|uniref:hypothetical protein n=1 Tax=Vibrio breoganii TaxID=553239 RepID=UPI000C85DB46|nr:hypothetical protein [Vibrio breoganii]PML40448.1 hypothetical protein BCT77_07210 [Vibrio breoganii]PMO57012.1 hypothetical protein BCT07_13425 [Vibrio breoganii]PMO77638.1 hypothetical protein BCT02_07405 [Vibrio breoganii]PMO86550.1 hypothetical protein BCS99_11410 [Vibrio breoganii]